MPPTRHPRNLPGVAFRFECQAEHNSAPTNCLTEECYRRGGAGRQTDCAACRDLPVVAGPDVPMVWQYARPGSVPQQPSSLWFPYFSLPISTSRLDAVRRYERVILTRGVRTHARSDRPRSRPRWLRRHGRLCRAVRPTVRLSHDRSHHRARRGRQPWRLSRLHACPPRAVLTAVLKRPF